MTVAISFAIAEVDLAVGVIGGGDDTGAGCWPSAVQFSAQRIGDGGSEIDAKAIGAGFRPEMR